MKFTHQNHRINIAHLVIFFTWASIYLYTPTLATFAVQQGATPMMVGYIVGVFGLIQALFRAPFGIISDQLRSRKLIVSLGLLAGWMGPLGMFFFSSPRDLFFFRAIASLSAATWPVTNVLVSSYYDSLRAPSIIAKSNFINALGNIFGMLIGGMIVSVFDQKAAFLASACLGIVAFVASLFLRDIEQTEPKTEICKNLLRVISHRHLIVVSALGFFFQIVITGSSTSFTPIYAKSIGANPFQLGVLAMLSMLGLASAGLLRDVITSFCKTTKRTLTFSFLILSISTLFIVQTKSLDLMFILQFIQGFSGYLILVVLMGECVLPFNESNRGSAMGIFHSVFGLGMFVGPLLSGFLSKWIDLSAVFLVLSLIALLGCLFTVSFIDTKPLITKT